ncbi:zf-HC2 domain-containing protein [Actinophytocola sp.]|uniref:zf-HC2 domain-containing protein n=1 Tax=Actinophytocola sp. TaxID=1872138 RepID=UPI002D8082F0|nr:zf-HC2 domain-containing protein [Actinophytocola sp.]HET9143742.1 zf-HC2 domain-containing protein [Actinophytocola sp.]
MTCTHLSTLGVYLLGALEPEDRSHFEGHLSGCDVCRMELVRLAPLPGLLNQITIADFDDHGELPVPAPESPFPAFEARSPVATLAAPVGYDPPPAPAPEPEPRPEPRPAANRRHWRRGLAAAAVVIGLTAGGIIAYEELESPPPAPPVQQADGLVWSASNPETGVRAEARLVAHDWGTEIQIRMYNVPPGESCRLVVWAKGVSGYRETAGWWATPPGQPEPHHPEIPGSTSIALSMISKLEVMSEDSVLLVGIQRP